MARSNNPTGQSEIAPADASAPRFRIETARPCGAPSESALTSVCVSPVCNRSETGWQCPKAIWLPELAPSNELLCWHHRSPGEWDEFSRRYRLELTTQEEACERLRQEADRNGLLLLYHEGDCDQNLAVVLKQHLELLECRRRWDDGLMIGGYLYPILDEVIRSGGLWYGRHRAWMLPDRASWKYIQSLLPGDF